jgi:SHS2 domain-containing protein
MTTPAGSAGFELLEHTADIGIRARGPSLERDGAGWLAEVYLDV